MIGDKEKKLPIVDIEEPVDETSTELNNEQSEDQEEFDYRNYPYLDIF